MQKNKKCGGILDSRNYFKAIALLKRHGISYFDIGFGFDRFFWYNGLYRVAGDKVFLIYTFGPLIPHNSQCIDFRECPFKLRLGL